MTKVKSLEQKLIIKTTITLCVMMMTLLVSILIITVMATDLQKVLICSGAIAEILRFESPTQMIPRRVQLSVELHQQKLSVGDEVLLLVGAANRDERQFENADCFDISRNPQDQISFGSGVHTCIGRHLAKLEARVYFSRLLERFPNYQVGERRYKASGWSRSFAEVQFSC